MKASLKKAPLHTILPETEGEPSVIGDGFVGIEEASRFLSISRAKLYQLMEAGGILYAKFGKSRRIPRRALIGYAEKCMVGN